MSGAVEIAELLGLPRPTPEQVKVIEAPLEPGLVVAGAGSGKTETMTARVVHLVDNGLVDRDRVLGLTFTRKAAGELSERVRRRLRALDLVRGRARRDAADAGGLLLAPNVSTYNAYAAALVGEHALRLGVEPSVHVLGEAGRWQLAHDVVQAWPDDLDTELTPGTVTAAVLGLAGALAEHLVAPADVRAFAEDWCARVSALPAGGARGAAPKPVRDLLESVRLRARLMDLVEEFTARKRAADLMDFADQVALAARLARESAEVGRTERARYAVVLLDEYQDTSVAQLALLRNLFGDGAGDGVGHPVTAVGDPHQSIYGWRGASAGGLERFPRQFPRASGAPAEVYALATSWRNDAAVLDAANLVAGPLREAAAARAAVPLPTLRARPGAGSGEVAVALAETPDDEARAVAAFVADRRAALAADRAERARAESDGGRGAARKPDPVTAAVLCRKRSQFAALHAALLAAGLPVEVVGLGGLLNEPEVVDLVAALEAAHDPSRGDSLMRLLTGPRARLGLADLHALADWARHLSATDGAGGATGGAAGGVAAERDDRTVVDALDELPPAGWTSDRGRSLTPDGRARLADLAWVLRTIRRSTALPLVDLVAEAERLLGLDIEVAARPGRSPAAARAHLDAFRSVAAEFDAQADAVHGGTLGAFLEWLAAALAEERGLEAPVAELDPDAVQLLTVHAAKGLEWDVVAVPGLVEGSFPVRPQTTGWVVDRGELPTALRGDREHLPDVDLAGAADLAAVGKRIGDYRDAYLEHHRGEERRLAYVALTRARAHLLLSAAWWGETKVCRLSAFLTEVVAAADAGELEVDRVLWTPEPTPGDDGVLVRPEPPAGEPVLWPPTRVLGDRQEAVERAAAAVRAASTGAASTGAASTGAASTGAASRGAASPGTTRDDDLAAAGELGAVAAMLLEERDRRAQERAGVALPGHLAASAVVRLAADPEAFALQLRRPVPQEPSARARRGTAFHAWVERYYGAAALVDVDALPGADDDAGDDAELAALQARFLASEWASRTPVAVEVDVDTPVGDVVVRCRIDAVFAEPDGTVVVVDWKTGRPPRDPAAVRARELQLAAYRLAWARRTGVPVERVSAAFVHVGTGETIRSTADVDALAGAIEAAQAG